MKREIINPIIIFLVASLVVVIMGSVPLFGEETLVKIAGDANMIYEKPEVKISPSRDVYVIFSAQQGAGGRSDIYLYKYSTTGQVSFVSNISNSAALSYEAEIDIVDNGDIHIAWCDQTGDTGVIKYRYFNGSTWSSIFTLGQVSPITNVEDLRIAVDPSGNVFVVFMHWLNLAADCKFISKYGNTISFENWPYTARSKHADIGVDANYIHVAWQFKESAGSEYTIAYQRRRNQRNSNWEPWVDLEFYGTQRPRLSLDKDGNPHVVFFRNLGSTRRLWYKHGNNSQFSSPENMTDPNLFETYHYCDVSAVDTDNVLVSMQKGGSAGGQFVGYNWKRKGQWSGYSQFAKSFGLSPAKQSIDLAPDRFFAAMTFVEKDQAVYLILIEEEGNPGSTGQAPMASFSLSPVTGHAPLTVQLNASSSTDSDGQIVSYQWDFGDNNTGTGPTTSHIFNAAGTYTINLTVTDNSGLTGTASKQLIVEPPNQPPLVGFVFNPQTGLYPLTITFDATASFDPDGVIDQYEWDFGDEQEASGRIVSHTFLAKGLYTVSLTVYDDDGDSASLSTPINVLGLLPPLDVNYESLVNRNLFTIQYVYRITWNRNPGNEERGAQIVRYNIYRKRPQHTVYSLLTTVDALDSNEYYDRIGTEAIDYQYAITAIDTQGRESDLPVATITPIFRKTRDHNRPQVKQPGEPLHQE